MQERLYWIWLSRIEKLGSIKISKLLEVYKEPKEIWKLKKEELIKIDGIGEKLAQEVLKKEYRENLEKYADYMDKHEIKFISIFDKKYPENLKNIYDPPQILYVKGNENILNDFSLAIVGCRQNSEYGKIVTKSIAKDLANKNIITVSGLAIGIDSIAQKEAVENNAKTIGVLGNGLDTIYPKGNTYLAQKIIENGGAIISEYVIGTKPEKMNFPARNRIISGISSGVIVIEAKEKSGTMITVDFALEQGKQVFAIPGNITSINSKGTNELIKQGAKMVTNINDILEEYSKNYCTKKYLLL